MNREEEKDASMVTEVRSDVTAGAPAASRLSHVQVSTGRGAGAPRSQLPVRPGGA